MGFTSSIQWCDVGNIDVFLTLQEHYGKKTTNLIEIDACNNLVQVPESFVANGRSQ